MSAPGFFILTGAFRAASRSVPPRTNGLRLHDDEPPFARLSGGRVHRHSGPTEKMARHRAHLFMPGVAAVLTATRAPDGIRRSTPYFAAWSLLSAVVPARVSLYPIFNLSRMCAAGVFSVTTPAKISQGEIDLFKAIQRRPDEMRGSDGNLRKVAGPEKKLPKRKVLAMDHPVLGKLVRELAGDKLSKGHGGSQDYQNTDHQTDTPRPTEVAAAETRRKKAQFAVTPHHGGTPADQPPVAWGIGQPQRPKTTTITDPKRAPGHDTYFHTPGKV